MSLLIYALYYGIYIAILTLYMSVYSSAIFLTKSKTRTIIICIVLLQKLKREL